MKAISGNISSRAAQLLRQKEGRDNARDACISILKNLHLNGVIAHIREFRRSGSRVSIVTDNKAISSELFLRKSTLEELMAEKMRVPVIQLRIR